MDYSQAKIKIKEYNKQRKEVQGRYKAEEKRRREELEKEGRKLSIPEKDEIWHPSYKELKKIREKIFKGKR